MKNDAPRPFLTWAGGKSKLVQRITSRLPAHMDTYYEPFLGGGAVLFELARQGRFKKAWAMDNNPDLVSLWRLVQSSVEPLIKELSRSEVYKYDRESYLEVRSWDRDGKSRSPIQKAARLLYLNKTCFNGLYRLNKNGHFNVPFGRYSNPRICDEEGLRAASRLLQKSVVIGFSDFENACKRARPGDGVYFDPPYIPASKTSSFTSYTPGGFGLEDHERLSSLFASLAKSGVRVVLSNSCTQDSLRLYDGFDRDEIMASRSIGGPVSSRSRAKEFLVFAGPLSAPQVHATVA